MPRSNLSYKYGVPQPLLISTKSFKNSPCQESMDLNTCGVAVSRCCTSACPSLQFEKFKMSFSQCFVTAMVVLGTAVDFTSAGLALASGSGDLLSKRAALVEGWALVEDTCPVGTGLCGARSCCPTGSYCDTTDSANSNFCCPTR
jgi:hypothetical protein